MGAGGQSFEAARILTPPRYYFFGQVKLTTKSVGDNEEISAPFSPDISIWAPGSICARESRKKERERKKESNRANLW